LVNKTYSVEEIFEDDPNSDDNVLMKIPEEIAEQLGWQPGDMLRVTWEDSMVSITNVENGKK
jgi:hypothetical protein